MSDKKISELINTTNLTDDDVFPIVQSNLTKKIKWLNIFNVIKDYITTGLGSKLDKTIAVTEAGTDLNDYLNDGTWFFNNAHTPTNKPSGVSLAGYLLVAARNENDVVQTWISYGSSNVFVRQKTAGTWSAWERLATEHDCYYMSGDSFKYYVKAAAVTRNSNFWFQIPLNKPVKSGVTPSVTITNGNLYQSSTINIVSYITTISATIAGATLEVNCDISSKPTGYSTNVPTITDLYTTVTFN